MAQILQTPSDILEGTQQPSFRIAKKSSAKPFLNLPQVKKLPIAHHRHQANPHLVLDLLQDLQRQYSGFVSELHDLQKQIQDLYLEGPLIDGWLQSAVGQKQDAEKILTPAEMSGGYCLCGLDEAGKRWSKPCPTEELPAVSLAIARFHRLKKLLGQKHDLEAKLQNMTSSLEGIYEEQELKVPTGLAPRLQANSGQ